MGMSVWYAFAGAFIGYVLGQVHVQISSYFKDKGARAERMLLFDKALTKGDAVDLYNLRVSDAVSQRKDTMQMAAEKEMSRVEEEVSSSGEPWSDHPIYSRCDISLDIDNGVFHVFDPEAVDGPDTWTEDIDLFMARFEDGANTTG